MSNNLPTKKQKNIEEILTLNKAEIGKQYIIRSCLLLPGIKTRLAEMGLVPNTVVTVQKKAPLGDPLEIFVRGYSLCVRATEAEHFVVSPVQTDDDTQPQTDVDVTTTATVATTCATATDEQGNIENAEVSDEQVL